jgi:hypothetical protein
LTSIVSTCSLGYAFPMVVLTISAVDNPMRRLYFLFALWPRPSYRHQP